MEANSRIKEPNPPIAVIGMGCLFPKASGLREYWRLVSRGQDAIDEVPETHWSPADYFDKDTRKPDHLYCTRGGYLSPVAFDPTEFGIPPSILEATDTSQLLGLLAAKAALEDAGYGDGREFDRNRASVILGVTGTQELVIPLGARLGHPIWRRALADSGIPKEKAEEVVERISEGYVPWQENSFPGLLGNVVAGRISNRLNLGGTNCTVDAACASSMSAMHLGLMELYAGRSDMVVTGGVDCLNDIFMHMCFTRTPILSPTGDVRPFSKHADGSILGEGIGILVFKRLADAERDNDRIYAVIRGMGSSSDGKSNSIYAPLADGQLRALHAAYDQAGFDPRTVGMIEAHGTGTRVGDAVEFKALKRLFAESGEGEPLRNACAIGSVKSMIGHTKASAGAAGLIKAVLSLYHKVLPPTLKAEEPDPNLDVENSPFYLGSRTRPWISGSTPRRAGVSSFGFGGSNFHMVAEEYQAEKSEVSWDGSVEIMALSSDTRAEMIARLSALKSGIRDMTDTEIALRAAESRTNFVPDAPHRLLLVLEKNLDRFEHPEKAVADAQSAFESGAENAGNVFFGGPEKPGKIAFVFPGQGSQYVNMGRDLACRFPEGVAVMEQANALSENGMRLSDFIYPVPAMNPDGAAAQEDDLRSTDVAQPAIGAVSLMMMKILRRFGITPDAVCGHSFGELSALCAAGRIDAEGLFRLAFTRGRLMAEAGGDDAGTMTAVRAPLEKIDALIREHSLDVVLANRNSPDQGVISGSVEAVEQAEAMCRQSGFSFKRLPVAAAFHSKLLKEAQKPFAEAVRRVQMILSEIPVFANTTGEAYPDDMEAARKLLADQLLSPVDFVNEIRNMFNTGVRTFVEVGPKSVLTGLVKAILGGIGFNAFSMDASAGRRFGIADLARLLCYLAALGHPVDLKNWEKPVRPGRKQKMSIPLCGANYRSSKPKPVKSRPLTPPPAPSDTPQAFRKPSVMPGTPAPAAPVTRSEKSIKKDISQNIPAAPPRVAPETRQQQAMPEKQSPVSAPGFRRAEPNQQPTGNIMTMNRKDRNPFPGPQSRPGDFVADAFRAVQEGLKSMQALQMQTAETHQKFLEAQTQAGRTLEHILDSTRRLAEVSMGVGVPENLPEYAARVQPAAIPQTTTAHIAPPAVAQVQEEHVPAPVAPVPAAPKPAPVHKPVAAAAPKPAAAQKPVIEPAIKAAPAPSSNGRKKVETAMLDVVSELTGYPAEMLSLDMDIEADLGIDSIKRVEILSAFEEKMPGMPAVSPEIMGSLKTLGQIVEYLTGNKIQGEDSPEPVPAQKISDANRAAIETSMLAVVSELTGYPAEMLSLDMDIEADLGIDSIKRVEILSAFEEKMPGLPAVSPEVMGSLKTLGQIVNYLEGESGGAAPSVESSQAATQTVPASAANRGPIESNMLAVVSELTGYPAEMLSLDMDIEADLGIDSIKRVEILSAFEEKMPGLPAVSPEVMGSLKTLGQIVDYLAGSDTASPPPAEIPVSQPAASISLPEIVPGDVKKKIVTLRSRPFSAALPVTLSGGRPVFITEDEAGLARALAGAFAAAGMGAVVAKPEALQTRQDLAFAGGLVILADAWKNSGDRFLKEAFALAHKIGPVLTASAEKGGTIFGTVSRMDGAFGFSGKGFENPWSGGLAGLAKTAAIEWEKVCCHALDVDPAWIDLNAAATAIVAELVHRGPVEVGLSDGDRKIPVLENAAYPEGTVRLEPGDLVVVTGGARGVTAAAALALARQTLPSLVLMGRSPAPESEPEWLASLTDDAAMKKAILAHGFSGKASPMELEKAFRHYQAGREIRENLEKIRATGADVRYYSVDVRDREAVRSVLDDVRKTCGPVKALIHGAGTLADRLITDKTPEQFEIVFDTKVKGLEILLDAVGNDPLNYLIFFSSVAARMGNKGQVDYAMANEVLNKTAQLESLRRPGCRVISFNWGPWDGGMVTPALRREFTRNHIELIPVEEGAMCMVAEMTGPKQSPVEVVIGAGLGNKMEENPATEPEAPVKPAAPATPQLSLSFTRDVDITRFPVLSAHVLDSKPVVPFALMAEWLGHGVLHENPGLYLHGLDDMRLFKGIRLDDSAVIQVLAGKARRNGGFYEAPVELRDGRQGSEIVHARAQAVLADTPSSESPRFDLSPDIRLKSYPRNVEEVYGNILFHGRELQGIREIMSCSPRRMVAKITAAPSPSAWMTEPLRSNWISDPLVLDCAFQMAIIWCYEQKRMLSLPGYAASYRQYRSGFPAEGVTAIMDVTGTGSHKMNGNFTFLDSRDQVVAQITGYEAIMDKSLAKAFQANSIPA